jgi:hypothetical protein
MNLNGEAHFQPRMVYVCLIVHSTILQVTLAHLECTIMTNCVQSLVQ